MTSKKIESAKNNSNTDNIYVFEKSVEAAEKEIDCIKYSLSNERSKAGILLGFFFLIIIDGLEYFSILPMFLRGVCFILIILSIILLILAFCSKKVKNNVDVKKNFKIDWEGEKVKFLKDYYEILIENIADLKIELTKNSKRNKYAIILLTIVILTIFINFNLPMLKNIFEDDKNPMESSRSEESIKEIQTNETENSMQSSKFELSRDKESPK